MISSVYGPDQNVDKTAHTPEQLETSSACWYDDSEHNQFSLKS
jgi:hypothetical protein